jgi:hypothetical protein
VEIKVWKVPVIVVKFSDVFSVLMEGRRGMILDVHGTYLNLIVLWGIYGIIIQHFYLNSFFCDQLKLRPLLNNKQILNKKFGEQDFSAW